MDEVRNPYAPGAGTPPPELAGREREKQAFRTMLQRMAAGRPEQNLALWGLRGVGKTVLLNDFSHEARGAGWGTGYVELGARGPLRPALAQLAAQAARELGRHERLRDRIRRALSVISAFSVTAMPAGVSFKLEVDPERGRGDSGQLGADLYEVLLELGEAAQEAGAGAVFFFDEMQFAEKDDLAALLAAYHRIGQLGLPVALVGAGLPQLAGSLAEASSYAERLLSYIEVGRLTEEAARSALIVPAEREQVVYEPEALALILQRADRYPFFLQTWGKFAWQVARESPIQLIDAQNADVLAREQLDTGFHRARFNRATPAERRYLAAMADLGDGPQLTADVSGRLGVNQQATAVQRQNLIDVKGLIFSPQRGYVDFTAPLFADYVRRQHPLESLL